MPEQQCSIFTAQSMAALFYRALFCGQRHGTISKKFPLDTSTDGSLTVELSSALMLIYSFVSVTLTGEQDMTLA